MKTGFFWGAIAATLFATPSFALDTERFESLVDMTIEAIDSEDVDIDELYRYQDELIGLGISGVHDFAKENAEYAAAMDFVASSADSMKGLNLVEIETEWHEGGALENAGIDLDTIYDDDYASTYMEAVIHPATAYIAVRAYEVTGDDDYLEQVRDELEEIIDHFDELEG